MNCVAPCSTFSCKCCGGSCCSSGVSNAALVGRCTGVHLGSHRSRYGRIGCGIDRIITGTSESRCGSNSLRVLVCVLVNCNLSQLRSMASRPHTHTSSSMIGYKKNIFTRERESRFVVIGIKNTWIPSSSWKIDLPACSVTDTCCVSPWMMRWWNANVGKYKKGGP